MREGTGMALAAWGEVWVEEQREADLKKLKMLSVRAATDSRTLE